MVNTLCFSPIISSFNSTQKPGLISRNHTIRRSNWVRDAGQSIKNDAFEALKVKATDSNTATTKVNSILCPDCEGNGNKKCTQCLGSGVNSVDHFNGQFKAGGLCWLCRGKKETLCGNCNGAGFMGGFMSNNEG